MLARGTLKILLGVTLLMIISTVGVGAYTEEQATQGAALFAANCAFCHAESGQGGTIPNTEVKVPELVGPTAFPLKPRDYQTARTTDFVTVKDIFDFASANMPPRSPGSLAQEEYWAIIAWALKGTGVPADGQELNATTAAALSLRPELLPVTGEPDRAQLPTTMAWLLAFGTIALLLGLVLRFRTLRQRSSS
ncbi:MAG: c-type cytochrome [Anaerolineae bacterium]